MPISRTRHMVFKGDRRDLNPQLMVSQTIALPIELLPPYKHSVRGLNPYLEIESLLSYSR